jgi:hypothetical protein
MDSEIFEWIKEKFVGKLFVEDVSRMPVNLNGLQVA